MITEEELCKEYAQWCRDQNLPQMSAEELIFEDITKEQREYLARFSERWENMLAQQEALATVLTTFDRCIADCGAKLASLSGKEVVYAFIDTGLAIRFPNEIALRGAVVVGAWNATPVNPETSALCITNGAGDRAQLTNWRALLEREIVRLHHSKDLYGSREGRAMVAAMVGRV